MAASLGLPAAPTNTDPVAGLALVAEVGAAIAATTSMPSLLATLRRRLKWLLPATRVSIALDEPGGACYRVLTAEGDETRHDHDEGVVGWALHHRMPLDLADVGTNTCIPWGADRPAPYQGRGALLVLPLAIGEPLGGVLILASPWAGAFAGIDRGLLNLIVLHVAAAVRTALLIAELDGAEAIIAGMARAVEAKDHYTQGHARRVTAFALAVAAEQQTRAERQAAQSLEATEPRFEESTVLLRAERTAIAGMLSDVAALHALAADLAMPEPRRE